MEQKNNGPQKWINTPFAFTRFSRNLSLLQQEILVKVSERLQPFVEEFFGSDLCRSHKKPKALFSEAVKNSGITLFDISYAELGVPVNNFYAAKEAARTVLNLTVSAPGVDENTGKPTMREYAVFSFSEMSFGNDRVVFSLNKDMVDYVFDMTEKYVSHPDDIAYIGTVDRMPMIYYLLRKSCDNKWKAEVKLTVKQIKEYLGMIEYVDGVVAKEAYPKFSQFRKKVLDTSIADINRLKKENLLDVCVTYEPVYNGKRKVGNPFFIRFNIYNTIEDMQKAIASQQQTMIFAEEKPGEQEWKKLLSILRDPVVEYLKFLPLYSYDGKGILIAATKEQMDEVEKHLTQDSITAIHECMKQVFGKQIDFNYKMVK